MSSGALELTSGNSSNRATFLINRDRPDSRANSCGLVPAAVAIGTGSLLRARHQHRTPDEEPHRRRNDRKRNDRVRTHAANPSALPITITSQAAPYASASI